MLTLQPRDKKLMSMLSRYGVLSTRQVQVHCFAGIAHTTVMRRLRKIQTDGLILRLSGLPDAMNAWCLTTNGARRIGVAEPCRYANQNTIRHEVSLSDVRMKLERVGLGEHWTSESELRQKFHWERGAENLAQVIPDGIFVGKRKGKPTAIAVELELTAKNHARYRAIFSQYAKKSIEWIWYVVANPAIGNLVLDQWSKTKRYAGAPGLVVSLLDEIVRQPEKARVFGIPGCIENPPLPYFLDCSPLLSSKQETLPHSAHGVSRAEKPELSREAASDSSRDRKLTSAPGSQKRVPSTADPSPPTSVGEGSALTGTKRDPGAEVLTEGTESEAA